MVVIKMVVVDVKSGTGVLTVTVDVATVSVTVDVTKLVGVGLVVGAVNVSVAV